MLYKAFIIEAVGSHLQRLSLSLNHIFLLVSVEFKSASYLPLYVQLLLQMIKL